MKNLLCHTILILTLCTAAHSQEIVLSNYSQDSIRIGEQLLLELAFKCKKTSEDSLVWPQFDDFLTNSVEIIERSPLKMSFLDSNSHTVLYKQNFVLTSFKEGENKLDPIRIKYKDSAYYSASSTLFVTTIAVDTTNNIYDIKPIQEVDYNLSSKINDFFIDNWHWFVIIALILVICILIYFNSKRKKPEIIVAAPIIPAHIPALKKLRALAKNKAWENDDKKAYYSAVTDTVRKYLEERFEIQALEETTIEIIKDLKYSDIVSKDKFFLEEILKQADMVKFAKFKPDKEDGEIVLDKSIEFVERTKEDKEDLTKSESTASNG